MASLTHRALVGHQLDTIESAEPLQIPDPLSGPTMPQDGTDPAAIVVSRRTLGWAGAALFALFSGGQVASFKLADDGPDPETRALGVRVDQLSDKMDQLSADGEKRDTHFNRVLSAVLLYQLESDRWYRDSRAPDAPPRSQELEAASQRLRALATP